MSTRLAAPYVRAFRRALATVRGLNRSTVGWCPGQAEATALSWAIGLELSPRARWMYAAWGSCRRLKGQVVQHYEHKHNRKGRKLNHLPREWVVDFSTYGQDGNTMHVALESEAFDSHNVESTEIDPTYGYNWDFGKLLYLPARVRVFVARVRNSKRNDRRRKVWNDLDGIIAHSKDAFLLDQPLVAYVLAAEPDGASSVGVWGDGAFNPAPLGTW